MAKTAIVTGASTGLGLAIAELLLKENYIVFGISKSKRNWTNAKNKIKNNRNFILYQSNISDENNAKRIIDKIFKKTGAINLLINNAGYIDTITKVENLSLAEFEKNLKNNLITTFLTSKYFLKNINKKDENTIINISSMAGKRGVPLLAAYSASKFGVMALSQCIAKENEDQFIKCVTICPGGINTNMRAKLFGEKDANKQQTTHFVANVILRVILNKIKVESGGDIVIRHGKITINKCPTA